MGQALFEVSDNGANINSVVFAQAEFIAHTPTALMVRGRVDDCRDDAALDELGTAANQKIAAGKL